MESPEQPQSEIPSTNPTLKPPHGNRPRIRFILSTTPSPPPPLPAGAGNKPIITMEDKFRDAIMKIANNTANRMRFSGRHKTLIEQTLTDFLADLHTPDHPPYAAMILRAIEELKEKRGSTEESISKYIKNEYKDLPWAHFTLLKHHLGKLCDGGEIIVTDKRRYLLAGANCILSKSSAPKKKLKRKRSLASGKMKSKRFKKDEIREDNQENEVMEGTYPLTGKYHGEVERQNEIVEREAEVIEEDGQLLKLPIEMIEEHVEDDQQHRKVSDYEANDQQIEMIEEQEIENIQPGLLQSRSGEVACDDKDEENTLENHSRVLPSGSHQNFLIKKNEFCVEGEMINKVGPGFCTDLKQVDPKSKPNVSDSERHIGLELVSMEQDEILRQLELLTPSKPQESKQKQAPEGSNQIGGQRSKLRSWRSQNTLEKNGNKEAESLSVPVILQHSESKVKREESSNTLGQQRSKLRSWKMLNQCEQNKDSLHSSLTSLTTPQKIKTKKPVKGKRGRPPKVRRTKLKLLKNLVKLDAEED